MSKRRDSAKYHIPREWHRVALNWLAHRVCTHPHVILEFKTPVHDGSRGLLFAAATAIITGVAMATSVAGLYLKVPI